jgi:hypothetical protein
MSRRASEVVVAATRTLNLDSLETRLRYRLGGRVRGLRVVGQGKGLVIQGHARTYYAKQLAQHAVMEATDLPVLANEIEVE